MVDIKLHVEPTLPARRADCILECIRHSITSQSKEVIVPLCSALAWPHPECWVKCWAPQFRKYIKVLECIQSGSAKLRKGLEAIAPREQLSTLDWCILKKRRLRSYCSLQLPKVRKQEGDADVSLVSSHNVLWNSSKGHQGRCGLNLNLRKYFF